MSNKKRQCRHCKTYFNVDGMIKVPLGYFCSYEHVTKHAVSKVAKHKQKRNRETLKMRKEALKRRSDWVQEAESAVRAYIRVRDYGQPCISCNSLPEPKLGGSMDAGHYRSKGSAPHLRFNCYNIHAQCVKCNRYNSGNVNDYRIGLIRKIGLSKVERLENDNRIVRYDIEYLKRIKRIFNKRARHLKKLRGYE